MLSPVVIRSHPLIRVNLDLVDLAPIWGLFALFGPVGAIFGVGVKFKNFFGTCLHRLTTFILEV